MAEFELVGEPRVASGSAAARRLRKLGKVPAVLFGGEGEPVSFSVPANEVKKHLENEAFVSHILSVKVAGHTSQAILREVSRDPVSADVTHMDLQRVSAKKEISMNVPLHFLNEDTCPGVKQGGIVTHLVTEAEIRCLPKDLPEFLEVDLAELDVGDTVHLSQLTVPQGVELLALGHGEDSDDQALVSVQMPKAEEAEEAEEEDELDADVAKLVDSDGED